MAIEFAEKPEDDVFVAILYGLTTGAMPLAVFLGTMPTLRTVPGVIWVGGTGVLFGVAAYCHCRAAPYLREEPGAWSLVREWRLLNSDRYEPGGRPFVRAQLISTILLPIWWLGGGIVVIGSSGLTSA